MMKPIPGFEAYSITDDGRVWSTHKETWKNLQNSNGYKIIQLWLDGAFTNFQLHRLVAQAFIPNPDNLPCVNHKDGNKHNNSIENLEWCSYSSNNFHAYETGLKKTPSHFGSRNPRAKLTEDNVRFIRDNWQSITKKELCKMFEISKSTINHILSNRTWSHI